MMEFGGCGELFLVISSCCDSKILVGCHLNLCSEFSENMAEGGKSINFDVRICVL
jgi:hypothetical protein